MKKRIIAGLVISGLLSTNIAYAAGLSTESSTNYNGEYLIQRNRTFISDYTQFNVLRNYANEKISDDVKAYAHTFEGMNIYRIARQVYLCDITWVDDIEYIAETFGERYKNYADAVKHPLVTLCEGKGDCEDRALLLYHVFRELNVPCKLIYCSNANMAHCTVMFGNSQTPDNISGYPNREVICEFTGE